MVSFKIFRGIESALNTTPMHEGYVYFCKDTGNIFIDISNDEGGRIQVNAYAASRLRSNSKENSDQMVEINIDDIFLKNMTATIEQGGTGANTASEALDNLGAAKKPKYITITLVASEWSNDTLPTQTVSAPGVTLTNAVTPSPDPASWEAAGVAGVYCSAQADNSLTFTCNKKPATALTYHVLIQEVG